MPYYLSPEQTRGDAEIGPAADVWALAVVTFECLTGERPFDAPSIAPLIHEITSGDIPVPSHRVDDLPEPIDAWFETVLNRDPNARFGSAQAMSRAFHLAAGIDERLSSAERPSGLGRSFDSLSVTTKTIRMDEDTHHEATHPRTPAGLQPIGGPVIPSDTGASAPVPSDVATVPNMATGLEDVDPDMAQLPPDMVAARDAQLASQDSGPTAVVQGVVGQGAAGQGVVGQGAAGQAAAGQGFMGQGVAVQGAVEQSGISSQPPMSDGVPPAPAFPPPMQVPNQPDPMTQRPQQLAPQTPIPGAVGSAQAQVSWPEESAELPMEKSRTGLWIGALLMILVGGGAAAFVLGTDVLDDGLFGSDSRTETDDDGSSEKKHKKKEDRSDEDDAQATEDPEPVPAEPESAEPEPAESEPPPDPAPPPPAPQPAVPSPSPRPPPASQPPSPPPSPPPPPPSHQGTHRRTLD
jgi:hypothetical protein